ncbi:hypothetical protein BDEG_25073 [Batrachochytrium dendrobatidis JEL423]|uniref:Uncharacterized protein n=1 Tax=Batrachochytrium dendrobatidis (strain JEL423) TaxID=403673 RepID=A0A177WPZ0_BATDL|nr:hypothetical protein BDEG_25073 [Batrachochytrium dendrobatidis JEL423]
MVCLVTLLVTISQWRERSNTLRQHHHWESIHDETDQDAFHDNSSPVHHEYFLGIDFRRKPKSFKSAVLHKEASFQDTYVNPIPKYSLSDKNMDRLDSHLDAKVRSEYRFPTNQDKPLERKQPLNVRETPLVLKPTQPHIYDTTTESIKNYNRFGNAKLDSEPHIQYIKSSE